MTPSFCMAPWVHSHITATGEFRACCNSEEEAEGGSVQSARTTSLEEYWNSAPVKEMRRKMLAGENVAACVRCTQKIFGPSSVLRDHYQDRYGHRHAEVAARTDSSGATDFRPISFDHRSLLCNFTCRMCHAGSSSSWRAEMNMKREDEFHLDAADRRLLEQAKRGDLEEIYWAGGEPLIMRRHWEIMQAIVAMGQAPKVNVRYSTNLSQIRFRGRDLVDLLAPFRTVQVFASIDATEKIGEFLRTGLEWELWRENAFALRERAPPHLKFVLDFTLTLPGLFDLERVLELAETLGIEISAKLIHSAAPTVYLSPLALPRPIFEEFLDAKLLQIAPLENSRNAAVFQLLKSLRSMPTFQEKFPETWESGALRGFRKAQNLAKLRQDGIAGRLTLEEIYSRSERISAWWGSLASLNFSQEPRLGI